MLRSLHEAIAQLGGQLRIYLPMLLASISHLLVYATHCICFDSWATASATPSEEGALLPARVTLEPKVEVTLTLVQAREARLWAIKVFSLCLQAFPTAALGPAASVLFSCCSPILQRLSTHYTQSPSGLLSALVVLSGHAATLPLLEASEIDSEIAVLPSVFAMLSAPRVARPVVEAVDD